MTPAVTSRLSVLSLSEAGRGSILPGHQLHRRVCSQVVHEIERLVQQREKLHADVMLYDEIELVYLFLDAVMLKVRSDDYLQAAVEEAKRIVKEKLKFYIIEAVDI